MQSDNAFGFNFGFKPGLEPKLPLKDGFNRT